MTVAILQSNYIPWKGYFDIIAKSDVFVLYDEVQYTKNDWRNRNLIITPTGLNWLTIPIRVFKLDQKINETKSASSNWNKKHLNSLKLNYAKACGFHDFKDILEDLYFDAPENLTEINLKFIQCICNFLGITTRIIDSRNLDLTGNRNERLVDACEKLGASIYLSGPSAKNYVDVDLFNSSKIALEWMDYSSYQEYPQLSSTFNHNVSIIDLILNNGFDSRKYLLY